jgi:hypothetical protein
MSDVETKGTAHGDSKLEAPVGLTVDVTPKIVVGSEVICEVDAAAGTPHKYVKGGLIKLPPGGAYTITFQLQSGDVPNLQFDTNNPFWSDSTCPSGPCNDGQLNPNIPCNTTSLVVDATPRPPKNAVHYRLNLTAPDGSQLYCDPIIINN